MSTSREHPGLCDSFGIPSWTWKQQTLGASTQKEELWEGLLQKVYADPLDPRDFGSPGHVPLTRFDLRQCFAADLGINIMTCSSCYWAGQKVCMIFVHKITFYFHQYLLIWIFWVCSWLSRFDRYQLQLVYTTMQHCPARNLQHETLQTPLTCSISHNSFSIHYTNLFSHFSCVFIFLGVIRHSMLKMSLTFFHLQY